MSTKLDGQMTGYCLKYIDRRGSFHEQFHLLYAETIPCRWHFSLFVVRNYGLFSYTIYAISTSTPISTRAPVNWNYEIMKIHFGPIRLGLFTGQSVLVENRNTFHPIPATRSLWQRLKHILTKIRRIINTFCVHRKLYCMHALHMYINQLVRRQSDVLFWIFL